MPHELNFKDGQAAMMYVGKVPWHGLGTRLQTPPTAEEAIRAAHLDWEVGLKPVYCMDGAFYYEVPGRKAVVRLDKWGQPDLKPFGLVHNDYRALQNTDAFRFFDSFTESGKVEYETAGALGEGERVWVLAKVKNDLFVKEEDRVQKYLLLSNGHDGKTALDIRFTPVRVVCQNTLTMSMIQGKAVGRAYHVTGMGKRVDKIGTQIEGLLAYYDEIAKSYERLANTSIDKPRLSAYLTAVFPDPSRSIYKTDRSYETALATVGARRTKAGILFEQGRGNDEPQIRGSLWAAYNGVTEYIDHYTNQANPWLRMRYACFGEGCSIKERALEEGLKIATAN